MSTPLSNEKHVPRKAEPAKAKEDAWLNPLNKLIWQRAFKDGAKRMTLRDGRVFRIEYETRKLYGEQTEMAWVRIAEGFITSGPCGWFVVSKVLDPMWVSKDQHVVTKTGVPDA